MNWKPTARFNEWAGCLGCAHYQRGRCVAYPEGIPLPIISGEVDHMIPRPKQVGTTVFEPMDLEVFHTTGQRVPARHPAPAG